MFLLIGGCACVGKTTAATALAARLSVPVASVYGGYDGPPLSPFRGADPWSLPAGSLVDRLIAKGPALTPNIRRLAGEHAGGAVLEGEGISPSLAADLARERGARAVFLVESDGAAIEANMATKSSTYAQLTAARRAKVRAMCDGYNRWLRAEAEARGQPWVSSRPWQTLVDRIEAAARDVRGG